MFGHREILRMKFFQLHHPPETVLCDRDKTYASRFADADAKS
jgi:hypothetical protein